MVILDSIIETPNGTIYQGAVKLIRKDGNRYVIRKDGLTAYADKWQLRFLKYGDK